MFAPYFLRRREVLRVVKADGRDVNCLGARGALIGQGVPQFPQKVRTTPGDEWKAVGLPARNENLLEGKTVHATDGAPLARRQVWQ